MGNNRVEIEKLDNIEKKHGVEINANAFIEFDDYDNTFSARVIGEVFGELNYDLRILMSIYNSNSEIIGTESHYIDSDNYDGIEPFSNNISAPEGEEIFKVRIYPQKS